MEINLFLYMKMVLYLKSTISYKYKGIPLSLLWNLIPLIFNYNPLNVKCLY